MITLIEKLTYLKYELPMASFDRDIQFLSYAEPAMGSKFKGEKSKINGKDQRLTNTSS
jgi:hypothetical protein